MGGGADHGHGHAGDFRSKVWSMSGGPYCRPKHWKRNTAIAMAGIIITCIPIAMLSAKLEISLCFAEWHASVVGGAGLSVILMIAGVHVVFLQFSSSVFSVRFFNL
ncbi:hypothetical protein SAY87_020474 [Trapa incisa]|uniref:Uncharacterized protein n=1 Tax=Trapa incisa TaxID=236973 RepID=A0AAN7JQX7_9MYRT|nr:hypothetical protein SAY87_020474 [Trapa incisa]